MNIKLTMIGRSGSGKSAYMTGLFERLIEGRSNGYNIVPASDKSTQDVLVKSGIVLNNTFTKLKNNFPLGTTDTTLYQFNLKKKGEFICKFEWIDYKGKVIDKLLSPAQLNPDSVDYKSIVEIQKHIQDSNGLIICVDAVQLSKKMPLYERKSALASSEINQFLRAFADTNSNRYFSIVIMITKVDSTTISYEYTKDNYYLLRKRCSEIFREIKELCEDNHPRWDSKMVIASAVGLGTVETQVKSNITVTKFIKDPDPLNVEIPLFYLIQAAVERRIIRYQNEIKKLKTNKSWFKSNNNEVNKLISIHNDLVKDRSSLNNICDGKIYEL